MGKRTGLLLVLLRSSGRRRLRTMVEDAIVGWNLECVGVDCSQGDVCEPEGLVAVARVVALDLHIDSEGGRVPVVDSAQDGAGIADSSRKDGGGFARLLHIEPGKRVHAQVLASQEGSS